MVTLKFNFLYLCIVFLSTDKLNKNYDSFSIEGENEELFGGLVSFKLNSFDYEVIKYDEQKIRKWTEELIWAERITKKYILIQCPWKEFHPLNHKKISLKNPNGEHVHTIDSQFLKKKPNFLLKFE